VRILVDALGDPSPEVRFWSAFALGSMRARAALDELRRASLPSRSTRHAASRAACCPTRTLRPSRADGTSSRREASSVALTESRIGRSRSDRNQGYIRRADWSPTWNKAARERRGQGARIVDGPTAGRRRGIHSVRVDELAVGLDIRWLTRAKSLFENAMNVDCKSVEFAVDCST
jgi:hypothetical protein